ncbi:prepilin-type N-terminal cleavage/methylation domain-containing protein [Pseudomonas sp. B329]|uniref:prepilin-type N-terminal cleavage/methylation domain-containing protein n=1 Tax=Pseudomonas sp. B329 TaxID=1553459 RepID=UPI002002D9B2|nr:prepilin-type N-terminal cleavage/methylation domain-containing protein [Pseudomonas sp. B329]MCK3863847.1 prepilin-type N-terminal cleavage/methylation domain-containing protein [Pseudomonas sp. B329]
MRRHAQGFTLLEVLIALSFLGVLIVLIGSALIAGNRMLGLSEHQADRLTQIRAAQLFLRSALQQAQGSRYNADAQVFEGAPHYMRFFAPLPDQLSGGMKVHILEYVAQSKTAGTLQIRFNQNIADGLPPWEDTQILMREVSGLHLSYKGLDLDQNPTGWLEQWPWPHKLPQAVRIEVSTDGGSLWPTQVIALRLDAEVSP